jgi:vacuolar-type H+-ATPase subunit I/STV1
MLQRNPLIERITRMRRDAEGGESTKAAETTGTPEQQLAALERRVAHLEQLLEGLQDSVHRESSRQSRQLDELEAQLEPAALAVALEEDARRRGL